MKTFLVLFLLFWGIHFTGWARTNDLRILIGGNAYVTAYQDGAKITDNGILNWTDPNSVISVFFYAGEAGSFDLSVFGKGHSRIKVSCNGQNRPITLNSDYYTAIPAGTFQISSPGYVRIDLQGLSKEEASFGIIRELIVSELKGETHYVNNFSSYWGRRGPSVHLSYTMPTETTEWFYNEITVPKEGEILHSYYMANGFGEGYFGIQYNSPTERRVLFSVWSPFNTQDPNEIPEEDKIKVLRRGEDVHIGEFGNEGSGGQSYLIYNWKAGTTYKFLTHIKPDGKGNTIYTAYFYATDENRWRLIASFLRPKTDTWYTRAHSFLENFNPEQGYLARSVQFSNQWALGQDGIWREITEAGFTYDATANAGVRLDYQGGLLPDKQAFYLKNGGFFNEHTVYGTKFEREGRKKSPKINFKMLETL